MARTNLSHPLYKRSDARARMQPGNSSRRKRKRETRRENSSLHQRQLPGVSQNLYVVVEKDYTSLTRGSAGDPVNMLGRKPHAGVAVVLALAMMTTLADGQGLFSRTPRDGDSCTTFMFTSTIPAVARILRIRVSPIPCGPGKVVNSAGDCVVPEDSDRCQPTGRSLIFSLLRIKKMCSFVLNTAKD